MFPEKFCENSPFTCPNFNGTEVIRLFSEGGGGWKEGDGGLLGLNRVNRVFIEPFSNNRLYMGGKSTMFKERKNN